MATSREGAPIGRPADPGAGFAPNAELDLVELLRNALSARYEIERLIGRGGSAFVLAARDRTHGDAVAIKVLRPELVEAVSASRFLLEIDIARRLRHPGILPVRDAGSAAGVPYYVMPFVAGGTLRARLRRERQLPVEHALGIARAVADALDHAHALGVVHRDINPANILLDADRVVVADFGIARALTLAAIGGPSAVTVGTPSGVALGTPEYMSPEQATADRTLDHRADVYALGCVVYEMLGGEPPFTGPSSAAIIARHCVEAPRSLRVIRPQLPREMERVIERALAKVPADRFATAGELVAALDRAWDTRAEGQHRAWWHGPWQRIALAMFAAAMIVALVLPAAWRRRVVRVDGAAAGDTNVYLVRPESGTDVARTMMQLTAAALGRWDGIRVVASAAVPGDRPDSGARAARAARAGREVRVDATTVGDSVRVRLTLVDTQRDSVLARTAASIPAIGGAATVAPLTDALLFGPGAEGPAPGTTSFAARRGYGRGVAALARWELSRADSELVGAIRVDSQFALAQLRLALVRQWAGFSVDQWSFAAERALDGAARLSPRDRTIAEALAALVHGDRPGACARWRALTRAAPREWTSWYGLGDCLAYDSAVVRDGHGAAPWRFRASAQSATAAFRRAFELVPAVSGEWVRQAEGLLHVSTSWLRVGRAAGDGREFVASASWDGDTLALRPIPAAAFDAGGGRAVSRADQAALEARRAFHLVARAWRARQPDNPEALEAVAVALDLLANPDAIDTLAVARAQVATRGDRVRLGTLEVWLRTKYALPNHLDALGRARSLADSLLAAYVPSTPSEAGLLGSLAALTGRATLAARYASGAMSALAEPPVAGTAPALVAFAALGGPPDTLAVLAAATERAIGSGVLASDRDQLRSEWLVRSALLAIPDSGIAALVAADDRPPVDLLTAWRAHDLARARGILARRRADPRRASLHAADVTVDAVFGEAAVLASLGDHAGAAAWLDPTLDSLSLIAPVRLSDPVRAATLVRAMALRADAAAAIGDAPAARRWARPVVTLWSDDSPFLAPVLRRMRLLAR